VRLFQPAPCLRSQRATLALVLFRCRMEGFPVSPRANLVGCSIRPCRVRGPLVIVTYVWLPALDQRPQPCEEPGMAKGCDIPGGAKHGAIPTEGSRSKLQLSVTACATFQMPIIAGRSCIV
jgi:hypothetical protein